MSVSIIVSVAVHLCYGWLR